MGVLTLCTARTPYVRHPDGVVAEIVRRGDHGYLWRHYPIRTNAFRINVSMGDPFITSIAE